jgi:ubiquinone/menaquinone biosynthesis C-methylase UbiE
MRQALERGCRATAVDHSDEMVDLTSEANAEAIAEGRLHVVRGDAAKLPFDPGAFTAAAMTHVFFFLPEPQAAIDECRRVLGDRGRLAIYTAAPELRGTPAAPEPIARQMRFYSDEELEGMAHAAGFGSASVTRGDGAQLLVAQV